MGRERETTGLAGTRAAPAYIQRPAPCPMCAMCAPESIPTAGPQAERHGAAEPGFDAPATRDPGAGGHLETATLLGIWAFGHARQPLASCIAPV